MRNFSPRFRRFAKRIRLARSIQWLCRFIFAGAVVATVFGLLDLVEWFDFSLISLAIMLSCFAVAGLIFGSVLKVSELAIAKSIDMRSGLNDRLISAITAQDTGFLEELEKDATHHLSAISEKQLFPIGLNRVQCGMVVSVVLPIALVVISANHLLLSNEKRQEREDVKTQAVTVHHVLSDLLKSPKIDAKTVALARQLERLQHDLERGKLDRIAAKERADKLAQKADQMMREQNQKTRQNLNTAQAALERAVAEKQLAASADLDPKSQSDLDKLSQQELKELALKRAGQEKMDSLIREIFSIQKQLASDKSSTSEQLSEMKKKLSELQKQLKDLKLSKAAQEMLHRMLQDPEYKKLTELMQKLQQNSDRMDNGEPQGLTEEQLHEMGKQMEELAKQLDTPEKMREYLKQMEEAFKEAEAAGDLKKASQLMATLQAGLPTGGAASTTPGPRNGAPLNMSDKEEAGAGTTHKTTVQVEQKPNSDPSPFIEQRGMAKLTGPSSIPMLKQVDASRHKAEEAISRQRIPKQQQERVKRYFESLEGKR